MHTEVLRHLLLAVYVMDSMMAECVCSHVQDSPSGKKIVASFTIDIAEYATVPGSK